MKSRGNQFKKGFNLSEEIDDTILEIFMQAYRNDELSMSVGYHKETGERNIFVTYLNETDGYSVIFVPLAVILKNAPETSQSYDFTPRGPEDDIFRVDEDEEVDFPELEFGVKVDGEPKLTIMNRLRRFLGR